MYRKQRDKRTTEFSFFPLASKLFLAEVIVFRSLIWLPLILMLVLLCFVFFSFFLSLK